MTWYSSTTTAIAADTVTCEDESCMRDVELASPTTNEEEKEDMEPIEEFQARRWKPMWKKILLGVGLVSFIVFVIVDSTTTGYLRSGIQSFLAWVEANPISGIFLSTIVYFVATILFIPGSILTLGAGFVFANAFGLGLGIVIGTLSVFIGASAGSIVAFLIGRYLLRDWVKGLTKKYAIFEALDIALKEKGFRIMTLLRLSPIIPFNAINYILGVTSVSLKAYCLSLFGIIPGTALFVFLGASAGSLADSSSSSNKTVTIIVVACGALFGIFAICLTSVYAKKELNRVIEEREANGGGGETEDNSIFENQESCDDLESSDELEVEVMEAQQAIDDTRTPISTVTDDRSLEV